LSKFDKYKKKGEDYYVYPHKHCQCGQMIDESLTYCDECSQKIQERKEKKNKRKLFKKKEKSNNSQDKIDE